MAETIAADSRADIDRHHRNEALFRAEIRRAKRAIAKSKELLMRVDEAIRRFNRN